MLNCFTPRQVTGPFGIDKRGLSPLPAYFQSLFNGSSWEVGRELRLTLVSWQIGYHPSSEDYAKKERQRKKKRGE